MGQNFDSRRIRTVLVVRPVLQQDIVRFGRNGVETIAVEKITGDGKASDDAVADGFAIRLSSDGSPVVSLSKSLSSIVKETKTSGSVCSTSSERKIGKIGLDQRNCGEGTVVFPFVYGNKGEQLSTLCSVQIEPLIQGFWNGESAAVIAYGQTGSGKSYVCGTEACDRPPWEGSIGVYLAHRVWELAADEKDISVSCGMIEIYREGSGKELVSDLLGGFERRKLANYADHSYHWHLVDSVDCMIQKLQQGSRLRATDATDGNARSSRSHAIFTLKIKRTKNDHNGNKQVVCGRILLVDLAGAEATTTAEVGSQKQRAGSGINVGLSTLQLVIKEVSEKGNTIHYRDSKLTHLLKPALGAKDGKGMAAILIGCISPLLSHANRTRLTLSYLQQAGKIFNKIEPEIENLESGKEYDLRSKLEALQFKLDSVAEENRQLKQQLHPSPSLHEEPTKYGTGLVVLTQKEHEEIIKRVQESEDRTTALEIVLRESDARYHKLKERLHIAEARDNAMNNDKFNFNAAADEKSHLSHYDNIQSIDKDGEPEIQRSMFIEGHSGRLEDARLGFQTSSWESHDPSLEFDVEEDMHGIDERPSVSALHISPVLAAAREISETQALKYKNTSIQGGIFSVLDCICLSSADSNLKPEQHNTLRKLTENRLLKGSKKHSDTQIVRSNVSDIIEALRITVMAYNGCLGKLADELIDAKVREDELRKTLMQAAKEKMQYVELVAKFSEALDFSQSDVVELQSILNKKMHGDNRSKWRGTPTVESRSIFNRLFQKLHNSSPTSWMGSGTKLSRQENVPAQLEDLTAERTPVNDLDTSRKSPDFKDTAEANERTFTPSSENETTTNIHSIQTFALHNFDLSEDES